MSSGHAGRLVFFAGSCLACSFSSCIRNAVPDKRHNASSSTERVVCKLLATFIIHLRTPGSLAYPYQPFWHKFNLLNVLEVKLQAISRPLHHHKSHLNPRIVSLAPRRTEAHSAIMTINSTEANGITNGVERHLETTITNSSSTSAGYQTRVNLEGKVIASESVVL